MQPAQVHMQLVGVALIAAGLVVGLAALVALHVLPTGLSPVRNAVSQYGISSYRAGYRVQTIAYALAGLGAALSITGLPGRCGVVVALCAVFAASRAAISWFPMDEPGGPHTPTGRNHGILAITAFVAVGAAGWRLAHLLNHDQLHPAIASASNVLALLMAVALVAMALGRRAGGGYFGLIERGFYAAMTGWLVTVAILGFLSI